MDITQFLHYIHVTPITEILSGFQIILQNFVEMLKKVPKGRFSKSRPKGAKKVSAPPGGGGGGEKERGGGGVPPTHPAPL